MIDIYGTVKRTLPPIALCPSDFTALPHTRPSAVRFVYPDPIAVLQERDQELPRQPERLAKLRRAPLDAARPSPPKPLDKQTAIAWPHSTDSARLGRPRPTAPGTAATEPDRPQAVPASSSSSEVRPRRPQVEKLVFAATRLAHRVGVGDPPGHATDPADARQTPSALIASRSAASTTSGRASAWVRSSWTGIPGSSGCSAWNAVGQRSTSRSRQRRERRVARSDGPATIAAAPSNRSTSAAHAGGRHAEANRQRRDVDPRRPRLVDQSLETLDGVETRRPDARAPRRIRIDDDAATNRVQRRRRAQHESIAGPQQHRLIEHDPRRERLVGSYVLARRSARRPRPCRRARETTSAAESTPRRPARA